MATSAKNQRTQTNSLPGSRMRLMPAKRDAQSVVSAAFIVGYPVWSACERSTET